jgi:hypothetical protein
MQAGVVTTVAGNGSNDVMDGIDSGAVLSIRLGYMPILKITTL